MCVDHTLQGKYTKQNYRVRDYGGIRSLQLKSKKQFPFSALKILFPILLMASMVDLCEWGLSR